MLRFIVATPDGRPRGGSRLVRTSIKSHASGYGMFAQAQSNDSPAEVLIRDDAGLSLR